MANTAELVDETPGLGADLDGPASSGRAVLDDIFEIDYSQRLPSLDSPQANAYVAINTERPGAKLFAIVAGLDVPSRAGVAEALTKAEGNGYLNVLAAGPALAPDGEGRRMAFVLDRPGGGRLRHQVNAGAAVSERVVTGVVLPGLLEGLEKLHGQGIAHRAVRPGNIFYASAEHDRVVLGECVSAPPGFDQPLAYEPLSRSLAARAGRGEGAAECDMFALGVTLVALLKGAVPADDVVLARTALRYQSGSIAVVMSSFDPSIRMKELLSGLLQDDPKQRWGIDDVYDWLAGRRSRSAPIKGLRDGMRPFEFRGAPYGSPAGIAHAFAEAPDAARHTLRERGLVDCLWRSCGDKDLAGRVKSLTHLDAKDPATKSSLSDEDLALVCLALDPNGPLRYRGLSIMPDGVGPLLATAMMNEQADDLKVISQVIERGLIIEAVQQSALFSRDDPYVSTCRSHQAYLKFPGRDMGLERCVYELNPGAPCLSDMVRNYSVTTLHDLGQALNRHAGGDEVPIGRPRDRHVIAFAADLMSPGQLQAVRLGAVGATQGAEDCMGDLAFFACIQRTEKTGAMRGMARWIRSRMEPALDSFRSSTRRRRLAVALNHAVSSGNLTDMLKVVRNQVERRSDTQEFNAARSRFNYLTNENTRLQSLLGDYSALARFKGRKAASILALVVFVVVSVLTVTGGF